MNQLDEASKKEDGASSNRAQQMIQLFTHQLDVSNPILTAISDAMTAEARAIEELETVAPEKRSEVEQKIAHFNKLKNEGQQNLMVVSQEHANQMAQIRLNK